MDRFTDSSNVFAVVGASENPESHSHAVIKALVARGSTVYVVHPTCFNIDGITCAPTLLDIDDRPDVIVVAGGSSADAQRWIKESMDLDLTRIWVEPQTGYTDIPEEAIAAGGEIMTGESILSYLS